MCSSVLIFGAGKHLTTILAEIMAQGMVIIAVADNDKQKHGTYFFYNNSKIPIISPEKIIEHNYDKIIVAIAQLSYQYEVVCQLVNMGVASDKIFAWGNNKPTPYPKTTGMLPSSERGRVFFDVSGVSQRDTGTGIQRVTNNLYRCLSNYLHSFLTPIRWFGELITSNSYQHYINGEHYDGQEQKIFFTSSDRLLLADLTLLEIDYFLKAANKAKSESFVIVYDLLPLSIPDAFDNRIVSDFNNWLDLVLQKANHVICISRTVANDVVEYYSTHDFVRDKPLYVHYFHLGFDLPKKADNVRFEIKQFVHDNIAFLMVGTVEPRKNHALTLKALSKIKQCRFGKDVALLIMGRDGWKNKEFKELLYDKKNVLWIKNSSDDELTWAYKNSAALLFPSQNEGFGLPIVEAAFHKLPIICSDIPIFHELVGENATYFKVNDEIAMIDAIVSWLSESRHPDSSKVRLCSWQESAEEVLNIIDGKTIPYRVLM